MQRTNWYGSLVTWCGNGVLFQIRITMLAHVTRFTNMRLSVVFSTLLFLSACRCIGGIASRAVWGAPRQYQGP